MLPGTPNDASNIVNTPFRWYVTLIDYTTEITLCCCLCTVLFHRVIESKNEKFAVGDYVVGHFGWRTKTISKGEQLIKLDRNLYTDKKLSSAIGILGMPG